MTSIPTEPPLPEIVPVEWRCASCAFVTMDPQLLEPTLDPAIKRGHCRGACRPGTQSIFYRCRKPAEMIRKTPLLRRLLLEKPPLTPAEPTVAHARRSDPETSHAAAASITPAAMRGAHRQVLGALHDMGPMTDEELVAALTTVLGREVSPSGARTRRSELVEMGRVADTGETRPLRSGRAGILWAFVPTE